MTILEYLKNRCAYGGGRAVPGKQIQRDVSLRERDLYAMIQAEREQGAPICAGSRGYFLPDREDKEIGKAELKETCSRMRLRGLSMVRTADAMEQGDEDA